jgi:putative glutamine amidotransferase
MKPVIAITPEAIALSREDGRGAFCGVSYSQAIELVGGIPVVLPLTSDPEILEACLRQCAGLLLAGGGDLSARYYSGNLTTAERATLSGVDDVRDQMEIYLVREALDADVPLLGICRGIQVLNVAAAGTVLPDIQLRRPGALAHRQTPVNALVHDVVWEPGARLTEVFGHDCPRVNSTHHQALDAVAPGFDVAARSPDGIIEAIEKPGARFACGVQFHPERLLQVEPHFRQLFDAFVRACRP